MFIIVQIPFADLRPLLPGERGRLKSPDWEADEPKGFVRGFGKISARNLSGFGLVGESRFADMDNAIRFPELIEDADSGWSIVPWFRRLYFDGQIAGRFEIGFRILRDEDGEFGKEEVVAPIRPALLAQSLLTTTVQINSIDGSKLRVPFARCSKPLGMAYLAASTSASGLMSYPIAETFSSFFFVGDPLVTLRVTSGVAISNGSDRRYLTSHNEPALFITSARGSEKRNNVIVQASERETREETPQERITRVLFAHLNSLIFAYAQLEERGAPISNKTNREILRTAIKRMIDRLAKFNQDAPVKDAAFSEGLRSFAKAYAGRVEELGTKLEVLSVEWNKPTKFERFGEYLKGVHDLIIRSIVEKMTDTGVKG